MVEKDVITAVFKYFEDNPDLGVTISNKLMVESDDTDVSLGVETGKMKLVESVSHNNFFTKIQFF